MSKDYQQMLEQIRSGELEEFEINTDEFMDFQKVLMEYSHRKKVVGSAKRGGGAVYHYDHTSEHE
ncbi:hypothetical protein FC65_GL000982 [Ligilactobacillus acidipiscis DSM 15836]|uniref:Uncharacterized protein n=2 Tax=Ligilactobacillus acidipiscis TaxID=89059 RepID=A0A0R2KJL0_9LACO|nr:hypothetical protein [Ligilactobacillus acidipiscis]KRM21299.1 hypothetical protein FC65_GL000982 [Ligilactobacillus acidipiscis DSM 15836]KRN87114.1 hypothetical protein IV43_GL001916 [Ligilactobacillus acidipiscis]WEV56183.1 hypothetical protein OZX66_08035 [Ligilactobacillus acidipiscis]SFV41006.1 hypothetical protein LAC1533_1585 [Ligilactobacillus acidipiscis]GAW63569.1 hypothetical protein Lacidipiscis_00752 [Ligilactobacillus acidipiscis]